MVLVDTDLQRWAQRFQRPTGEPVHVGPASIDLRLATDLAMQPGQSVLMSTEEYVDLRSFFYQEQGSFLRNHVFVPAVAGLLTLRTSLFRAGVGLAAAGWVDPGYYGNLTVRLIHFGEEPIHIAAGNRFVQLILFKLNEGLKTPYEGQYQGSVGAVGSRLTTSEANRS